ncbi:MAG: tRNA (adenosine(37)-N6)-threonylcarbamoyltransferase complex dimerization subunit type 1 TsaB [Ignavibacteriaceae bacterium]
MKLKDMNNLKPVLAIETSGSLCGAAVYFSDEKFYEVNIQQKNIHAEKIFEVVDNVLNSAGTKLNELSAVAVSSGPGSFTGLRIGMSAAKGLAFGASLPIIPVPTFEALALQISSYLPENAVFAIANKINSDEIYYAKFQIKSNNFIFAEELQIIDKVNLNKKIEGSITFGNAAAGSKISVPAPVYIAKYSMLIKEKLTFDYDYLEPDYLKNFTIKERKNV